MKTKLIFLGILIALIFPTYSFFLSDKMFTFNDETQIANLYHYFKTIDLGQFPPRWAAGMHFEYGSPFPGFNYQLPYYLGYLGHLADLPLTVIFKLLLVLSVVAGAAGMFFAGIAITGSNFFAFFAAVLYTYTPYQSIDHFVRGSLGEVFALALFPWIFLAGYSILKKDHPVKVATLGILLAALILSHQPAALVTLPFFALIFITPVVVQKKYTVAISYLKSVVLAFLLSAYYWIPVIFEKQFIKTGGPFNYLDQFPFIKQLIYSAWSYQGANPFSSDTFSFQIGLVNLLILALATIYFVYGFIKKQKKSSSDIWLFRTTLVMTLVAIFLMNIRSDFVWRSFSLLQQIQFPWRLLMFTTWFTPLLFLLMVTKFPDRFTKPVTFVLLVSVIAINVGYFRPGLIVDRKDQYYQRIFLVRSVLSPGETVSADYLNFAEDYAPLPVKAVRPKALPAAKLTPMYKSTKIEVFDGNPLSYVVKVDNKTSETLTFHTFNYPGWEVSYDDVTAIIKPDEIGAITFALPPGSRQVKITFGETPLRTASNIISTGAIVFTLLGLNYYLMQKRASSAT